MGLITMGVTMRKQTKQIKNPKGAGRKKLFNEKYHNEIIDTMKKGQSLSFFASKIGVSKQTIYNWINENKDFKESTLESIPYSHHSPIAKTIKQHLKDYNNNSTEAFSGEGLEILGI